jgi:chromosome segregation ATPase
MSQIFLCISQELDNAKRTILTYESTLKESERELQKDANQGQGVNQEGWKAQQMKREYQSALRDANDQLNATEQKLDNLWKEKVDLVREHQEALAATEDRAVIAEEKVAELEEKGT